MFEIGCFHCRYGDKKNFYLFDSVTDALKVSQSINNHRKYVSDKSAVVENVEKFKKHYESAYDASTRDPQNWTGWHFPGWEMLPESGAVLTVTTPVFD